MKKKIGIIVAVVIALIVLYILGTGFGKVSSAYIGEYSISSDGTEMSINVSVGSSVGFIRKVSVHQQQGGKLYLDCYSAFGGVNGSIGAKSQYTIPINNDTEIIAINRNSNCYEEVLKKDSDGKWQRVR